MSHRDLGDVRKSTAKRGRCRRSSCASYGRMTIACIDRIRSAFRFAMVAFYIAAGIMHLRSPEGFLRIMPPVVPFPGLIVLFTGCCEIAGAIGLLIPRTRLPAGVMLALYAICVWPSNIYHAFWHIHVPALPDSWWYHGPRMLLQPVLVWWALFAGAATSWPFEPSLGPRARRHSKT